MLLLLFLFSLKHVVSFIAYTRHVKAFHYEIKKLINLFSFSVLHHDHPKSKENIITVNILKRNRFFLRDLLWFKYPYE